LPSSTQLAFILNLEQHWFTLRRFGPALPNIDDDPGDGHWFNLNSSLSSPEWVGKLYLGMVLQQAEADGKYIDITAITII
jgi:Ataxin-3